MNLTQWIADLKAMAGNGGTINAQHLITGLEAIVLAVDPDAKAEAERVAAEADAAALEAEKVAAEADAAAKAAEATAEATPSATPTPPVVGK